MTKARELKRGKWVDVDSLTVAEARAILDAVSADGLAGMCRLNPGIPREMGMDIFRRAIAGKADEEVMKSGIAKNIQREFGQ